MAIHHVPDGYELRVVGPAKADVTGDYEEYMKVKPFYLGRPPALTSISPSTAVIGGEPVLMECIGTGIMAETVIVFNGGVEPTTVVDQSKCTTMVYPSTAGTPGSYPVVLRTFTHETAAQQFTFTETAADEETRSRRKR